MKKTTILGLGLAGLLLGLPKAASAQITVTGGLGINIAFPEPPPLVVVRPGIQIVPEQEEEVYFTGGYYWVQRDNGWFRCHDWRGRDWRPVEVRYVPVGLARIPPGRFRHYYRDDDGRWRPHHDQEWHDWRARNREEERRAWWRDHMRDRQIRMEQERAWRERQREDRELERAHWQEVENRRRERDAEFHRRQEDARRERENIERQRREDERRRREDQRIDWERNHPAGPPPGHGGPPPGHGGPPPGHRDGGPGRGHHH